MCEACGQDNIASASIQTYDAMETFNLKVVDEKLNLSCVRKEPRVEHCESEKIFSVENCVRERTKFKFCDLVI